MELYWLILMILGAVAGFLLFVFMIWCCLCWKKKSRGNFKDHEGQNGKVWQANGHIVDISDEEDNPNVDGLCKDTISGSTIPRRSKSQKSQPDEDGLCRDTRNRSLRRGKLDGAFQTPEKDRKSASEPASQSDSNSGVVIINIGGSQENIYKDEEQTKQSVAPSEPGFLRKDLIPNGIDSSRPRESNDSKTKQNTKSIDQGRPKSTKGSKVAVERKRSKSIGMEELIPQYTKPVKRAVSNPSIVARQKMIQKDKRFESLHAWKCSIPIPEPDYPLEPRYSHPKNDHPPSTASDSGVECVDSISDPPSVPESPGTQPPAQPNRDREGSFLAMELRPTNSNDHNQSISHTSGKRQSYSGDGHLITTSTRTTSINLPSQKTDHPPPLQLPTTNFSFLEKDTNQPTQPAPELPTSAYSFLERSAPAAPPHPPELPEIGFPTKDNTIQAPLPPSDLSFSFKESSLLQTTQAPMPELPPGSFLEKTTAFKNLHNTRSDTKTTPSTTPSTSSWVPSAPPTVDFRNIKLHETQKQFSDHDVHSQTKTEEVKEQTVTGHKEDAKRLLPSAFITKPQSSNQSVTVPAATTYSSHSTSSVSYTTYNTNRQTTEKRTPLEVSSNNQVDFRAFKLRPTPESVKQHIGFREELHSKHSQPDSTMGMTTINTGKNVGTVSNGDVPQTTHGQNSITKSGSQLSSAKETSFTVFNLPNPNSSKISHGVNSTKQTSMNGSVVKSQPNTTNVKSADLVNHRLEESKPIPGTAVPSNEAVVMRHKDAPKPSVNDRPQTPEQRKKNWKREQMEHRLSSELVMNERQPLFHASGLALKSVLPELFTKIKERDTQENSVTIAT